MNVRQTGWPFTALVVVDTSPRWLYAATAPVKAPEAGQLAMACIIERISTLMQSVEEADLPNVAVESQALARVRLADLRGPAHRLGIAGVYGEDCVLAIAERLQRRGYCVVILEDACLWSRPLAEVLGDEPRLSRIPRARVLSARAALTEFSLAWQGEPPHL